MHVIYEYLFTALIIVTIVVAASTMLTSMTTPLKMVSEREQLKVTTEKLLSQILLSTGAARLADGTVTADWGRNLSVRAADLTSFGLAKFSETTRESFVLDVDKVQRLSLPIPELAVTAGEARDPLRLIVWREQGIDYGFAIEIYPTINVTIGQKTPTQEDYTVTVTNDEGLPLPSANITALMYYVYQGVLKSLAPSTGPQPTDVTGSSTMNFTKPQRMSQDEWRDGYGQTKVLALIVDYYGARNVQLLPRGKKTGTFYVLGDHMFIRKEGAQVINPSNVTEILAIRRGGISSFTNVTFQVNSTSSVDPGFNEYVMEYVEPSATGFLVNNGTHLYVASRSVQLVGPGAYTTILQPGSTFPLSIQLQRVVTIADQTYVFKLYVWRMSSS
ncbi:MAG: hypothetical protein QW057_07285 [Candidatus Bathyarchaeia archaeon]